jgi:hypothetical protein
MFCADSDATLLGNFVASAIRTGLPSHRHRFLFNTSVLRFKDMIEIRSRLLIEFEILRIRQSLGNSVNVLTAVPQRESFREN